MIHSDNEPGRIKHIAHRPHEQGLPYETNAGDETYFQLSKKQVPVTKK
jgi:hypothetical protein